MPEGKEGANPNRFHLRRLLIIWAVLTVIITPIVYFVWGPNMPPGDMANNAADQQFDNTVLSTVATPVVLFIWVFFAYALYVTFSGHLEAGPEAAVIAPRNLRS